MMPIPRNEPTSDHKRSEYRLLYVGRDAEWFRRLKSGLGLPANRLVYCSGDSVEHFLRSDIRYDLFQFDLDLLNETGVELIRLVRSFSHRQDTPIIIVSSDHATRQQRIDALRAGAWEYLGQPLDAEHLLLKLETFTRVKRAADRAREDGLVDPATGLYNLSGLARRARELGAQASRLNGALACVALAPDFGDNGPGSEPTEAVLEAVVAQLAGAFRAAGRTNDGLASGGRRYWGRTCSGSVPRRRSAIRQ